MRGPGKDSRYNASRPLSDQIRESSGGQLGRHKERNEKLQRYAAKRLSVKERRVDALALRAEERRDKLRKAVGRSKYPEMAKDPVGKRAGHGKE